MPDTLPNDIGAEEAVLSAAMLDIAALDEAAAIIQPDDWFRPEHRHIWRAMLALRERSIEADAVTVAGELGRRNVLSDMGGAAYISQLVDATPSVANVGSHARVVRKMAQCRATIGACARFAAEGRAGVPEPDEWLQRAAQAVYEATTSNGGDDEVLTVGELAGPVADDAKRRAERKEAIGISTGLHPLDKLILGWEDSRLYIVAGRPGMGKTALKIQLTEHTAEHHGPSVFVSLEQPRDELIRRRIASRGQVDLKRIRSGALTPQEVASVYIGAEALRELPMVIHYQPGASVHNIRGIIRRAMAKLRSRGETRPLKLVAVDYLQLMSAKSGKDGNRESEISKICRDLKALAGEFNCPVLAGSQLNRGVESRPDKRPKLSDLRESGSIEQDSDTVLFVYRDEVYNPNTPDVGKAEIIAAKVRNGTIGTAEVDWDGSTQTFSAAPRYTEGDDALNDWEGPYR